MTNQDRSVKNLIPIRPGEVRNPNGRKGRSGVTLKTLLEVARETDAFTGLPNGLAVTRMYYQIAVHGVVPYSDGTSEKVPVKERLKAMEAILTRIDPAPKDSARAKREDSEADLYRRMLAEQATSAGFVTLDQRATPEAFPAGSAKGLSEQEGCGDES